MVNLVFIPNEKCNKTCLDSFFYLSRELNSPSGNCVHCIVCISIISHIDIKFNFLANKFSEMLKTMLVL